MTHATTAIDTRLAELRAQWHLAEHRYNYEVVAAIWRRIDELLLDRFKQQ